MQTLTKKRARAMLGNKLEGFSKGGKEAHNALGAFTTEGSRPPTDAYYLPDNWRAALAGARAHACHDEARPFLCQIVLTGEYAVATDGYRLARLRFRLHHGGIPTGALEPAQWVRLPSHIGWEHFPSNGNAHVKVWMDQRLARLGSGGLRLDANREAGRKGYPDDPLAGFPQVWDRVIPGGEPTAEITFCPRKWVEALRETQADGVIIVETEADASTGIGGTAEALAHIEEDWFTPAIGHSIWSSRGRGATLRLESAKGEWARQCVLPHYLADALEAIAPDHDSAIVTMQCYGRKNPRGFGNDPIVLRRGDSLALVMPRRM